MISSLAYLGITTPSVAEWPAMATEVLGCMVADPGADGAVRLRFDDAPWRLQLHPGEVDDVAYIGWTINTEAEFEEVVDRLRAHGVEVHEGDDATRSDRFVRRLSWFLDPAGFRHELTVGQVMMPGTFHPGRSHAGFVTGEQGLGHVVLGVPSMEEAHAFFTEVLGFRLSDWLFMGNGFEGRFYHVNGRHHTLALGELDGKRGLNHLMLEVADLDDVGIALDRCEDGGYPIVNELGRHTNDQMTSFYFQTPSAFMIEYGYAGLQVGANWTERTYHAPSIWGHRLPAGMAYPDGLVVPV